MNATAEQVQRIVDEIDVWDAKGSHADIRRALEPILNEVAGEALRKVRAWGQEGGSIDFRIDIDTVTRDVADEMGVTM